MADKSTYKQLALIKELGILNEKEVEWIDKFIDVTATRLPISELYQIILIIKMRSIQGQLFYLEKGINEKLEDIKDYTLVS